MVWIKFRTALLLLLSMMLLSLAVGSVQAKIDSNHFNPSNNAYQIQYNQQQSCSYLNLLCSGLTVKTSPLSVALGVIFSEDTASDPISQQNVYHNAPALLPFSRWQLNQRQGGAHKLGYEQSKLSSDDDGHFSFLYPSIAVLWRSIQTSFYGYISDHRLSGWKETNALYVALNGHFLR
ncbi:hypothetical protein BS333_18695 [Vibrio azureus]|uniref:Uncharacterized protein n=1 Tax=Vibrio azureus NBRC 104587 TaxID=1219077 RepID=U3C8M2_9VIBR|nr:hypothetical protein [Vibrio azureus]AUI88360.1 hypothetical protein BS333_18695 [Vibrio azureus]GAD77714.1 hypothetical protein VAZ01S_087_00050 [Vibrio azureus NBRC 104587]